jgi:putative ABC transport system ATP-binding protein
MGASGSGKSTLLNILGGMDRPTSGRVLFGDRDLAHASDRELTLFRRREIGFIFQFYNLMPTLTAQENVEVGTEVVAQPMNAREALELVGMGDRADHFPSQLSGGQQQRVAIARAIAGRPRLLLCDEPTGALDSKAAAQVIELLTSLNESLRKTVVFVTHNPKLAQLGDRLAVLHDGAVTRIEPGGRIFVADDTATRSTP